MKILKIRTVKAIEFGGLKFGQGVDLGDHSIAVLNGQNEAGKSTLMELMSWDTCWTVRSCFRSLAICSQR